MKDMRRNLYIISLLIVATGLVSCNKFLDEKPSKSTSLVPTTTAQLDYILNDYSTFYFEPAETAVFGTDLYALDTKITDAKATLPTFTAIKYAAWDTQYLAADATNSIYFTDEYAKIFKANMVLYYLSKVDGSDADKQRLEREAKFIRAYSTWNLAQVYCLPYTEVNKNEPGMTIKASTSFQESSKRATLEETYKFIESDLDEALKITTDMELVDGKYYKTWRASKAAVNGFAARYWLNRNDYDKAYKYAAAALESHGQLVNYNTDMYYSKTPFYAVVNKKKVLVKFPYTHDNAVDISDQLEWKEMMYYRMLHNYSFWYIPSQKLLDSYDHTYDLRYKYHVVTNYTYYWGTKDIEYPGYVFFYNTMIISGPTTSEMILIEAECLARQGKFTEAMAEVNKLRAVRMDKSAPDNIKYLSATSKEEAIHKILDERIRELTFTQRWNDIRRLNNNEDVNDDVGDLTKTYYPYNEIGVLPTQPVVTYTLKANSRRYATPIPEVEITASNGAIEQNKY